MTELQQAQSADVTKPAEPMGFLGMIGMALGILVCVFRALVWAHGVANGEVLGYAVGGMIVCCLIAYAIAGRKRKRNLKKFGLWFGAIGLILLCLEVSNSFSQSSAKPRFAQSDLKNR